MTDRESMTTIWYVTSRSLETRPSKKSTLFHLTILLSRQQQDGTIIFLSPASRLRSTFFNGMGGSLFHVKPNDPDPECIVLNQWIDEMVETEHIANPTRGRIYHRQNVDGRKIFYDYVIGRKIS